MEQWKKIELHTWKPQAEGDSIIGVVMHKELKTNDISARYKIENQEGYFMIWGSMDLDDKMYLVKVGDKVRITYIGKKLLDKNKTLNLYTVDVALNFYGDLKSDIDVKPVLHLIGDTKAQTVKTV